MPELAVSGDAVLDPVTAAGAVPSAETPLIGRTSELDEAYALLADYRVLSIVGPGGLGKTRLAQELARRVADGLRSDVRWVELAPVSDAEGMVSAVARALGVSEADERSTAELVYDQLLARPIVLVLDNLEQVRGAGGQISRWLRAAPGLTVIATSRRPLRLLAERVYRPGPLPVRGRDADAVRLFRERARAAGATLADDAGERTRMERICQRLDGLPLAIQLAASQASTMSIADIERGLAEHRALKAAGSDVPARHRTLTAAVRWSSDLLTAASRSAFGQLSVFAGGFDREAVGAVVSQADADDLLDELVDHSLILRLASRPGRYRMLETVRQVAAQIAVAEATWAPARTRHASFFLELSRRAAPELSGAGREALLRRLDVESHNLRAALDWYVEQQDRGSAAALATSLRAYWIARGQVTEGRRWMARVMGLGMEDAPTRGSPIDGGLASMLIGGHRWRQMLERQDEAHAVASAGLLATDGALALWQGHLDQARRLTQRAIVLYRSQGRALDLARALATLGEVERLSGNLEAAHVVASEAVRISEAAGDLRAQAVAHGNLALIARDRGRTADAQTGVERAVELFRRVGDERAVVLGLINLAAFLEPEDPESHQPLEAALAAAEQLGDPGLEGLAAGNLGNARSDGGAGRSSQLYARAIRLLNQVEDAAAAAHVISNSARLFAQHGQWEHAVLAVSIADSERRRLGVAADEADADEQDLRARAELALGDTFAEVRLRAASLTTAQGTEELLAALDAMPAG